MSLRSSRILLDNQWHTYYAGQDVKGRVEYTFDSPVKIKGISVEFEGKAKTFWTEKKTEKDSEGRQRMKEEQYSGEEKYFKINYFLIGNKNGPNIVMPPGTVGYDFRCTLPPKLPASFADENGYIRYSVIVTLETNAYIDKKTSIAFKVVNTLDLNKNSAYKKPIHLQLEKNFCCLWCKSAPLSVDVRAPATGFCSGQTIPFDVNVENQSNVEVDAVRILLRKIITLKATKPTPKSKVSKTTIAQASKGAVPAGETKEYKLQLKVPQTPPSNLFDCSIIDLYYEIKVVLEVSGPHQNLVGKKCITIGTVPLVTAPQPPRTIKTAAPLVQKPTANDKSPWTPYGSNPSQSYPNVQDMAHGGTNIAPIGFEPPPPYAVHSMPVPYS